MSRKDEIQSAYKYLGNPCIKRLSKLYEEVSLDAVESMACFTCKKY